MQRAAAHYLPRDMAVLGLVELALSFGVGDLVMQSAGAAVPLPELIAMLPSSAVARAAIVTLVIGGVALVIGLYRPEVCLNPRRLLIATAIAAVIAFGMLLLISGVPRNGLTGAHSFYMGVMLTAWLGTMSLIRLAYGFAFKRLSLARRVLFLGSPAQIGSFTARLRARRDRLFDPVVLLGQTVSWQLLVQNDIWGIVVASEPDRRAVEAILDCKLRGMRVFSGAAFNEHYLGRIDLEALTATDLIVAPGFATSSVSAALKRAFDLAAGSAMLILTLPLMAATAVAIKLDSAGPAFYRQQRVGHFGKTFTLYKFRSMAADAEASGSPRWAQQQDPRVTRIGRFIRAARIDELPQLVNVLRGEMSLVGPRPERPHFVEQLVGAIPFYRQRSYVKPGLTGWAQVNFRYGASVEDAREKLSYDMYYVKNRSMMLDLIILISTVRVVLFHEGAR